MEHGVVASTWFALAAMILVAKIGGELAIRAKQPAVLGELLAGVALANVPGLHADEFVHSREIGFAAELGVMLLLFQVGLQSSVREMVRIAARAGAVAFLGVVFPSVLGFGVSAVLLPEAPMAVHLFIGATLCATSVGITAAVLKDLGALGLPEAKVILGAAVIDDVLGLIVLAIVSALATRGGVPDLGAMVAITGTAIGFVVGALVIGLYVTRGVYRVASVFRSPHVLGAVSIAVCLLLAGASLGSGLAAIVGAYAAGLILDEVAVRRFVSAEGHARGIARIEEFVSPIAAVFAPVFFVRTGLGVKLSAISGTALLLALALVVVGVVGKLGAGLGVRGKGIDRLTIGLGMTPRGEVGLIFADAGARLIVGDKPLFSKDIYAALVIAVFATTLLAPPALAARIRRVGARGSVAPPDDVAKADEKGETPAGEGA